MELSLSGISSFNSVYAAGRAANSDQYDEPDEGADRHRDAEINYNTLTIR